MLKVGELRFNDKLCCWIIDVNGGQELKALLTSFCIFRTKNRMSSFDTFQNQD